MCVLGGIAVGALIFVAARVVNPPPIDPLDAEYWDLLGTPLPRAELTDLTGRTVDSHMYHGRGHVLLFADPGCAACETVYPTVFEAARRGVPVLVVYRNGVEEAMAKATAMGLLESAAYDTLRILSDQLYVDGYPTAVYVDEGGTIRKAAGGDRSSVAVIELAMAAHEAAGR